MKSWDEIRKDMMVYIKDPIKVYEDDIVIGETKPFQEAYVYNCDTVCATLIVEGGEFDGCDFYWYFKEDEPEEILTEKEYKLISKNFMQNGLEYEKAHEAVLMLLFSNILTSDQANKLHEKIDKKIKKGLNNK